MKLLLIRRCNWPLYVSVDVTPERPVLTTHYCPFWICSVASHMSIFNKGWGLGTNRRRTRQEQHSLHKMDVSQLRWQEGRFSPRRTGSDLMTSPRETPIEQRGTGAESSPLTPVSPPPTHTHTHNTAQNADDGLEDLGP